MNLRLKGKNAFITASTSGIGLAIAKAFLAEGANVVINGKNGSKLYGIVELLRKDFPDNNIIGIQSDLTREDEVNKIGDFLKENKLTEIHALVLNFGTSKKQGDNLSIAEWQRFFDVNLYSSIRVFNQVENLLKLKGGSVIFISSIVAVERIPSPYAYASSKSGIIPLVKNLAFDYADYGIRVNCVAPGNIYFDGGRWQEIVKTNPNIEHDYIQKEVPLKRFGTPEEIADSVIFLSSERSSFTTGATLIVDGGQTRSFI